MTVEMRVLAAAVVVILAAGCGSSRPAAPTTTTTTNARVSLPSPRTQQIALARASSDLFSIFPAKPGAKRCAIPEGGVHFTPLRGRCVTSIRAGRTHEATLVVSFRETWSFGTHCGRWDHCLAAPLFQHTWRVIEAEPMITQGARFRVAATRESGAPAPQYYK